MVGQPTGCAALPQWKGSGDSMGMFDDLTCDYALPDRPEWARSFQTKDLNCWMDHYHIHEDGRLVERSGWDGEKYAVETFVPWTGGMRFYECKSQGVGEATRTWWVEYIALFKHGRLLHVELLTLESPRAVPAVEPAVESGQG